MAVTVSITLKENSYSVADNTSSVTCTVKAHWTYGSWDHNNLKKTLTFGGSTYTTTANINKNRTNSGSITLFSKTKTITHNADGSKSVSASVKVPTRTSSGTVTASKSLTLTKIPRYASSNQSISTRTDKTITMAWSSNATCDYIWYSIDGGKTFRAAGSVNTSSGSYTISGLSPKTTYNIVTRVRRKDSQLSTNSSVLSAATYAADYFTLDLVASDPTLTSVELVATTKNTQVSISNQTKAYSIIWSWYISGYPNNKEQQTSKNIISNNGSASVTINGLIPGKDYVLTANLYKGTPSGSAIRTKSVTIKTIDMGGKFKVLARSSNAINVGLSGQSALNYPTRADFYCKKSDQTSWGSPVIVDISAGSSASPSAVFSKLTQMTNYDFIVYIYKVASKLTLIKQFSISASTYAYFPGMEDAMPYFDNCIVVPHTGKAYLKGKLQSSSALSLTVHIFGSSVEDSEEYADLGVLGSDMTYIATGTVGETMYYKLGLVDRNGNVYNLTEPYEVTFTDYSWSIRVQDELFDISADEMQSMVKALTNLYDYKALDNDMSDMKEIYEHMKERMTVTKAGSFVEGGAESLIYAVGSLAKAITETGAYDGVESGSPCEANDFNGLASLVTEALETIQEI